MTTQELIERFRPMAKNETYKIDGSSVVYAYPEDNGKRNAIRCAIVAVELMILEQSRYASSTDIRDIELRNMWNELKAML